MSLQVNLEWICIDKRYQSLLLNPVEIGSFLICCCPTMYHGSSCVSRWFSCHSFPKLVVNLSPSLIGEAHRSASPLDGWQPPIGGAGKTLRPKSCNCQKNWPPRHLGAGISRKGVRGAEPSTRIFKNCTGYFQLGGRGGCLFSRFSLPSNIRFMAFWNSPKLTCHLIDDFLMCFLTGSFCFSSIKV